MIVYSRGKLNAARQVIVVSSTDLNLTKYLKSPTVAAAQLNDLTIVVHMFVAVN